jgi:N-acetylmuramoyl-L-alanine amidase
MVFKRIFSIIILVTGIFLSPLLLEAQKVKRVVIDAGHGGHDPGAVGKNSKEKDIVLSIALKTGKYIKENLKDVEVIYTRKTDVFVELFRRARIANEAKADLFISIHCNANPSTSPFGSETYVMGLHRSDANLAVAQLENASILLEDDYHVQYDGFDPKSPEGYIFFSMLQNAYLDQSLTLASHVQKNMKESVNLFNRGVKQAGFLVLYKTTMPSILVETGFISNLHDEKVLISEDGQNKIAFSIYKAVRDYKQSVEKERIDSGAETVESVYTPDEKSASSNNTENTNATVETGIVKTDTGKPVFKVQFYMSDSKLSPVAREFKGLKDVTWYRHQGSYKYTIGNEKTPEEAQKLIKVLADKGFKDSFVVAFLNGERITIDEARRLLKN